MSDDRPWRRETPPRADMPRPTSDGDEARRRLDMPLAETMSTQRAIRRLLPDPVDDAVLARCLELAVKAPTGSAAQNWEFVIVRDRAAVSAIGRLNRRAWSLYGRAGRAKSRRDEKMLRLLDAVQWQADHFEEIPVLVVPCLRASAMNRPFSVSTIANASSFGSIFPAVQNFLLAARAVGLGVCLTTLPLWNIHKMRSILGLPRSVTPCCVIPVGWPRGRYGPTTRKPLEEVVHVDRYGNHSFDH